MTDTDRSPATLVQQHLAAAGLLLTIGDDADLYITTTTSGGLSVQVPTSDPSQQALFRRVALLVQADVITTKTMTDGARHLVALGGSHDGIPVYLYAPLPKLPEAVVPLSSFDTFNGGTLAPTARDFNTSTTHPDWLPAEGFAPLGQDQDGSDDARVMAQADADQEARDLGFHDDECRAELENDARAEAMAAEAAR